ncbi:hypothetical protein QTP70_001967 [Hemibagrus guttatus]|uniref:Reverse transcriptase domain-containing protein n=1 Tax=Hemibagrus guttatus TaxID=175788 RepID=A0AAE0V493_9TELE|nr:hypothetical protein QTP70_001967 [Hemibagrus guttatus]
MTVDDTIKTKMYPYVYDPWGHWWLSGRFLAYHAEGPAVVVSEAKTRVWEEFGEAIEKDYWTASGKFWQTVRRLRRGKQLSANTVYGGGGELLVSTGDIVGRWKEYFEDLLNPTDTPSAEEPEAEDSEVDSFITQAEVTEVVQQLLGGKAPGVDEICPEYLKSLDVVGLSWLTHLCNIAWRSGTVPLDWATGVVVPLFKKGDRRVCSNYRGFTLLSLPGKVYSRVLERRVRPLVEPRIQEQQCGFRPSRGTLDQLYTLHRVLEGSWKFAQPVHMCFVDLEKAFDRVPRDILWEVLWEYGVHGPLLRAVRSLYNRSRSLVRIASCKSDLFSVHVGLRQGCPLSPVLFIVFMDRISRCSQGLEGVRFGDHRISSLIFADDVVLLASSGLDLQHALGRFAAECEAAGMRVSTSKSEAMVLDRKKVVCTLQVGGEVLPQVEEFKYLGVLFTSEERMDREIDRRIGAAAAVMQSMYWSVVVKKELSRKAKLSIYQSIYVPTLTYGHELWVMTERRAVEVARASVSDASGTSPWRGVPGMPHREEALGKTQDTLERLSLSAGLGTPRGPSGRAGGRVWGEGVSKTITTRSNQKPWMTAEVRALLKMRDSAFRAEDKAAFRTARAKLSRAIRKAKRTHTQRIPGQFQDSGNSQRMWQGMQKSAGPDNIPDRVLRECAEQLADVFTDIFNISLSSAVVPMCLKTTTIIPVPKKSTVSCLSDYHLVVLTPIVMKCFERFVMRHIKTQLPPSLDPLQLAYRPNRSTEDAITPTLHLSLTHLDNNDTHV